MLNNKSVFITVVIEACKRRKIVTLDIQGAYLHTDMDEEVATFLKGRLAELMGQVNTKMYQKYVITNTKGLTTLYV